MEIHRSRKILINMFMGLVSSVMLFPILIIVNISLKTRREFIQFPLSIANQINIENFAQAWDKGDMNLFYKNSFIYTIFTVIGIIVITAVASYPISRKHLKISGFLYKLFLSGLFLPTSLVPLMYLMRSLGFINTYHGYIIFAISAQIPVSTFIFCGFVKGVPRDLDDAALVDGCPYFSYIFKIMFPIMKPAIVTVAMLSAIGVWNDFIGPLLFLVDRSKRPLTTGLYSFFGQFFNDWTVLSAGILIVATPLIVFYLSVQRHIVSGITSGAVKG